MKILILLLLIPLAACNGHYLGGFAQGYNNARYGHGYANPELQMQILKLEQQNAQMLQQIRNRQLELESREAMDRMDAVIDSPLDDY